MSEKLTEQEILSRLKANEAVIRGFGVRSLGLFGSFVHGENTETSDLDLVVEFDKKTFDAYMDLKLFLETLFDRPVDLVLADAIKSVAVINSGGRGACPGIMRSIWKTSATQ